MSRAPQQHDRAEPRERRLHSMLAGLSDFHPVFVDARAGEPSDLAFESSRFKVDCNHVTGVIWRLFAESREPKKICL
jgi:hypothetical protein